MHPEIHQNGQAVAGWSSSTTTPCCPFGRYLGCSEVDRIGASTRQRRKRLAIDEGPARNRGARGIATKCSPPGNTKRNRTAVVVAVPDLSPPVAHVPVSLRPGNCFIRRESVMRILTVRGRELNASLFVPKHFVDQSAPRRSWRARWRIRFGRLAGGNRGAKVTALRIVDAASPASRIMQLGVQSPAR